MATEFKELLKPIFVFEKSLENVLESQLGEKAGRFGENLGYILSGYNPNDTERRFNIPSDGQVIAGFIGNVLGSALGEYAQGRKIDKLAEGVYSLIYDLDTMNRNAIEYAKEHTSKIYDSIFQSSGKLILSQIKNSNSTALQQVDSEIRKTYQSLFSYRKANRILEVLDNYKSYYRNKSSTDFIKYVVNELSCDKASTWIESFNSIFDNIMNEQEAQKLKDDIDELFIAIVARTPVDHHQISWIESYTSEYDIMQDALIESAGSFAENEDESELSSNQIILQGDCYQDFIKAAVEYKELSQMAKNAFENSKRYNKSFIFILRCIICFTSPAWVLVPIVYNWSSLKTYFAQSGFPFLLFLLFCLVFIVLLLKNVFRKKKRLENISAKLSNEVQNNSWGNKKYDKVISSNEYDWLEYQFQDS